MTEGNRALQPATSSSCIGGINSSIERTRSVNSFVSREIIFSSAPSILLSYSFKFFSYISFSTYKGLFPDPFRRNFILMSISYFNIIAENIIKAYFQGSYSCPFALAVLKAQSR